jgi:hypothetical protein
MVDVWANQIITSHVRDSRFADVGGLWGLINEKITVAVKAGCRAATMIDFMPMKHQSWSEFDRHAKSLGVAEYRKFLGNIDDPNLPDKVGTFDFVHCSGVIYHVPNPLHTLSRLYALTERFLFLGSMTVPTHVHTSAGEISFAGGRTVFLPAVDTPTKEILAEHFRALGIKLTGITDDQYPWTSLLAYGPWWWLWTEETLAVMARSSGFRILEIRETWRGRAHAVFCEKIESR